MSDDMLSTWEWICYACGDGRGGYKKRNNAKHAAGRHKERCSSDRPHTMIIEGQPRRR